MMQKILKIRIETWFLILFIPLSLAMMLVMPILRTPDEPMHLLQTYVIADGQLGSSLATKEISVPENLISVEDPRGLTLKRLSGELQEDLSETRVEMDLNTDTAIYPPLSYFPQAAGMRLAMFATNFRGGMVRF